MNKYQAANKHHEGDFEKILFKIVFLFFVYTKNHNKKLVPHFNNLRSLLQNGYDSSTMRNELIKFSNTLSGLGSDTGLHSNDATLLFGYLKSPNSDPTIIKSLNLIQQRYVNGEFNTSNSLFEALKFILGGVNSSTSEHVDLFREHLQQFIKEINIPLKYSSRADLLCQSIVYPLPDKEFKAVTEDGFHLLSNIQHDVEEEQNETEQFLTEFSKNLKDFETLTNSASAATTTSIENRERFTTQINSQFEAIKESTSTAKELLPLQENINTQLTQVIHHFNTHKQEEDQEQRATNQQLKEMSNKITELEAEATTLRSNLEQANSRATHDPLTGLFNRLAYDEKIAHEQARWKRYGAPLSLMIWDIDHFKSINDTFGHNAGDKTLCLIAQLLQNNCRESDFVARFGGEEFVMLLPNTSASGALILAETLRKKIAASGFNYNGKSIKITISCGITEYVDNDEHEAVFERADNALYKAKSEGRNRCIID